MKRKPRIELLDDAIVEVYINHWTQELRLTEEWQAVVDRLRER